MPRSRSERRHHHHRMMERAKDFFIMEKKKEYFSEEEYHKHLAFISETKKPCSCHMCGNPRRDSWSKSEQLTMQERRANEALRTETYNE